MDSYIDYKPLLNARKRFVREPSAIFVMLEFLPRDDLLNKIQLLCRDMYCKKVPLAYQFAFFTPTSPTDKLFVNMGRSMNKTTHQYRGKVPTLIYMAVEKQNKREQVPIMTSTTNQNFDKLMQKV